jgi:peptide/nickel transport system substrate-binding protein
VEALRDSWFEAPDLSVRKMICEAMQVEFWRNPPYVPMGMINEPTAFDNRITDVPES